MNKKVLFAVFALLICFLVVSCDENQQLIINPTTPSPTIRGTVSIPDSADLSGSDFYIRVMEGEKAVYTGRVNSDGSFSVPGLSEEATYSILLTTEEPGDIKGTERDISRATTSGYGGWLSNVTASINEQAGVGSIKVKPLGTIKGVVKKDGAEDNYDTTVYIPGTSYLSMTDGEGNFSLFNVPQATYTLRYISNGYMAKMVENVVLYSESDTENPVTTVQQQTLIKNAGNLIGTISKTGSSDHSNITVMLSDGENVYTGSTGTDGSLMITGILPGTYSATISASGFITQTVESIKIEAAKNTTINPISLIANGGNIRGSIVLSDGREKSGVSILVRSIDGKYSYTGLTDSEGLFLINNCYPGTYELLITKTGYGSYSVSEVAVVAGQDNSIGNVVLTSVYGSVSGKVSLSDSVDNSGVTVTLTFIADPTIFSTTVSGPDGTYAFNNLTNAGQYSVTFSKDGFVSSKGTIVTAVLGQNQIIEDITLKSLASKVYGTATLEETEDYTGISILLKAKDNSRQYDATTDQQGNYVFARVNPGEYTLIVSKAGYVSKNVDNIIVEPSTEKSFDNVSLSVGVRSITGIVRAELKTDFSGTLVTATNLANQEKVYSAITNSEGVYTLAEMIPGEYQIVISHTGYRTMTLPTVDVIEGTIKSLDSVEIEINRGTISGVATLEGRTSSAGVIVELLQGTTVVETRNTNSAGEYSFYVPQGNYSGVRMIKEDFKSESVSSSIALFADNFISIDSVELLATHNSIFGKADVLTTDDESDVVVRFDDHPEIASVLTDASGAFAFEHVPVGAYIMRLSRENVPDIVISVSVGPCDEINLGTIKLTPDSATIIGKVNQIGGIDLSGVLVVVDMGTGTASATTDSSGRYEIGGVSTEGTYTVSYSKEGWDTASQLISPALDKLEIREMEEVSLTDTHVPVISSVSINDDANASGSRTVSIKINASDIGNGIKLMQYSWTDSFSASEWITYQPNFVVTIPEETNGTKTLRVRVQDYAGNNSETVSDSIELVGQIRSVHGQLSDRDLHWTIADNPIVVTANVIIPEGKTLVIDPGVDVLFDGAYSIQIRGTLSAIGTEENPIVFRSSRNYMSEEYHEDGYVGFDGLWGGVTAGNNTLRVNKEGYTYSLEEGSILSNCIISDIGTGLKGNLFVSNCTIKTSYGWAIGNPDSNNDFTGVLINSDINGGVKLNNPKYVFGNLFTAPSEEIEKPQYNTWANGIWIDGSENDDWYHISYNDADGVYHERYYYKNNRFYYYCWADRSYEFINNKIEGYEKCDVRSFQCTFKYNTIDNCGSLILARLLSGASESCYNQISNIGNTIECSGDFYGMTFSNICNNPSNYVLKATSKYTEYSSLDFRYNYWGEAYTQQLQSLVNSGVGDASFLYDGMDDPDLSTINWSGFASELWSFAGYQGDGLVDFEATYSQQVSGANEAKVGSDVEFDLKLLTDGTIGEYRIAQSLDDLLETEWTHYYGSCSYLASDVDYDLLTSDGALEVLIQVRTTDGHESSMKAISVGYNIPYVSDLSMAEGQVLNTDAPIIVGFTMHNHCVNTGSIKWEWYVDDIRYDQGDWYWDTEKIARDYSSVDITKLENGTHELKFILTDKVGDTSTTIVHFEVDRPTPVVTDLNLNKNSLEEGEPLVVSMSLANCKHLKEIRILSDDFTMLNERYDDNGNIIRNLEFSIDSRYLSNGSHTLSVELEDYSGNITKTQGTSFSVNGESVGPTISGFIIFDNQVFSEYSTETWNLTFEDNGGVKSIVIELDDTKIYEFYDDVYQPAYRSIPVTVRFRVPSYTNGNHIITIKTYDYAGNETTETRSIVIDKDLPTAAVEVANSYPEYKRYYVTLSNSGWIYDGCLMVDDIPLKYFFLNSASSNDSWIDYSDNLYYSDLPAGNHTIKAKFRTQGGDVFYSNELQISVEREKDTSSYGLGKTWNEDGSLRPESSTRYLWGFNDESMMTHETVSDGIKGQIKNTTDGIGGGAASMYYSIDGIRIPFLSSEWTMEFWMKDENESSDDIVMRISGLMTDNWYNRIAHNNSNESSYWGTTLLYYSLLGDTAETNFGGAAASRNDYSNWHHYALVSTGERFEMYMDGVMVSHTSDGMPAPTFGTGLYIDMVDQAFIDELRISATAKSVDELWDYVQYVKSNNLLPD